MVTAGNAYARAVKSLWKGKCTVTVRENVTNKAKGRTEKVETDIYTDEPCRISFENTQQTGIVHGAAAVQQSITLFLDPGVIVPPGSKITVIQDNVTAVYANSGKAAIYSAHQEISLELFKGWA